MKSKWIVSLNWTQLFFHLVNEPGPKHNLTECNLLIINFWPDSKWLFSCVCYPSTFSRKIYFILFQTVHPHLLCNFQISLIAPSFPVETSSEEKSIVFSPPSLPTHLTLHPYSSFPPVSIKAVSMIFAMCPITFF